MQETRKLKKIGCLVAGLILVAAMLTGCIPAGYTKEHKKEITEQYAPQALAWFTQNMPEAKVKNDAQAYVSGSNLTAAIEGSFSLGSATYKYLYDYIEDKMYTSENYQESVERLTNIYSDALNVSTNCMYIVVIGNSVKLTCENDDAGSMTAPKGATIVTASGEYLPSEMSTDDIIDAVLAGEPYITMGINCYVQEYPEFDSALLKNYPGISGVTYYAPVELPCENAIISRRYQDEKMVESTAYFQKLPNGMYAGYLWSGEKSFEDKVEFTQDDGKNFSLKIPDAANPIIISEKKVTLTSYFTNSAGKEVSFEIDKLYVSACPGRNDYVMISTDFITAKNNLNYYETVRNVGSGGEYHYKVK